MQKLKTGAQVLVAITGAIAVLGCQKPAAVPAEQSNTVVRQYSNCLQSRFAQFDDGKLPASAVAAQLGNFCIPEFRALIEMRAGELTRRDRRVFLEGEGNFRADLDRTYVLRWRVDQVNKTVPAER